MTMDLIDRIETTRFLGGEFLLWLWFSRDVTEGDIQIPNLGTIDVALESQLMLADPLADHERVTIRGFDPLGSPEADQALRRGKLPRKVGLRLIFEHNEWVATLDTASLGLSGVKLPALLSQGEEEHFFERMRLFEQLHDLVQSLYGHFLGVRLSPVWQAELAPAMARWVKGSLDMDQRRYDALHRRAGKAAKRK
jgi:hypothetical protein